MFPKNGFRLLKVGLLAVCVAGPAHALDPAAERAIVTAREALARHSAPAVQADQLVVLSVNPHTWTNSGLACSPPRAMTSPVITEGFVVVFALPDGGEKRVNVAGSNAFVCDLREQRRDRRIAFPAASVGPIAEKARADLAERLGVPVAEIGVVKFTPVRWKDSALECSLPGETITASPVRGYRLQLRHNDQTFTYHTDYQNVRPCPPLNER